METPDLPYWEVPRCFEGETVAILGGGKSLTQAQVDYVKRRCYVIAINRAFRHAPWAAWLYGCDPDKFWKWHPEAINFPGVKIVVRGCADMTKQKWAQLAALAAAGVKVLRHSGRELPTTPHHEGVSGDPAVVRGNNSCYQLLSVIAHTGASRVLLLGMDMRGGHWHGGYGTKPPEYALEVVPQFATLVKPLTAAGVAVVNCSLGSKLPYFGKPKRLEDVL